MNELTSQLTQQTEYSASMGAACATLLWRVSRRDDAVESLLSGVSRLFFSTVYCRVPTYPSK